MSASRSECVLTPTARGSSLLSARPMDLVSDLSTRTASGGTRSGPGRGLGCSANGTEQAMVSRCDVMSNPTDASRILRVRAAIISQVTRPQGGLLLPNGNVRDEFGLGNKSPQRPRNALSTAAMPPRTHRVPTEYLPGTYRLLSDALAPNRRPSQKPLYKATNKAYSRLSKT